MDELLPVVGRHYVVDLVRELVERPEVQGRPRDRHTPILVVEGRPGAGKTRLLTALGELMDQRIPHAALDLRPGGPVEVPQLLSALAFSLSRRCPGYGRLRFPRLVIGLLVMDATLNLQDRVAARKQVRTLLSRHRGLDPAVDFLQQAAAGVLGAGLPLAPQVPTGAIARAVLWTARLFGAWRPGRRVIFGRHLDWFGRQGPGPATDATEVLIELNRRARQTVVSRADQRYIDHLLLAAFLADLRDTFRGPRTAAGRQSLGCAVLLDNADEPAHRNFLRQLAAARQHHLAAGGTPDPLTVVVTGAGRLTQAIPDNERGVYTGDEEGLQPFLQRTGHPQQARWLRCALRDLTEDEVGELVDAAGGPAADPDHLRHLVHAATGGQPLETRLLLDAAAAFPGGRVHLDAALRRVDRDVPGPPPETRIVERLLAGVPEELYDDLVTCSAARDEDRMLQLATQGELVLTSDLQQLVASARGLWRPAPDDRPLLLRRLLLRRLADRPAHAPANWDTVHSWLQKDYEQDGNEEAVLFHMLARHDLAGVTRLVEPRLGRLSGAELLAVLRVVTAAPNTLAHSRDPVLHLQQLTAGLDPRKQPFTPLARLIAGLWLAGDPMFSDHRAPLHWLIAAEYNAVAAFCPVGAADLLIEAQRHQQLAQWWQ